MCLGVLTMGFLFAIISIRDVIVEIYSICTWRMPEEFHTQAGWNFERAGG